MFDKVYFNSIAKKEEERAFRMISSLYDYFNLNTDKMPPLYVELLKQGEQKDRVICDYLSSMTDRYAVYIFEELFIPKSFYLKNKI